VKNWLVKGGTLIEADGIAVEEDILIEDGIIVKRGKNLKSDYPVIDATGLKVLPGLTDMHVHLREPGFEEDETIFTGTRAAALGGFTAVAAMPNTEPVLDNASLIKGVIEKAQKEGAVRVYPFGAVTKGQKGEELAEMADMHQAGAIAFSDDGHPIMNSALLRHALEYTSMFQGLIVSHSEDLNLRENGVMNEGYWSTVLGLRGIPAVAEEVMVARDIMLSAFTSSRLHLAHLSTKGSIELLKAAKKQNLKVTGEVAIHHLILTEEAVKSYDTSTKVNPPLRSLEDQKALKEALKEGIVDCLVTDHAPHAFHKKDQEYDFAPFGISGLETALPLAVTYLVKEEIIDWPQLVQLFCLNPRRILKVKGGTLETGTTADLTIIDDSGYKEVDRRQFYSKGKNTPFHGFKLTGWPLYTMVEGHLVVENGKLGDEA